MLHVVVWCRKNEPNGTNNGFDRSWMSRGEDAVSRKCSAEAGRAAGSAVGGLDTTRAGLRDIAKALHKRWVSHGGKLKVLLCL